MRESSSSCGCRWWRSFSEAQVVAFAAEQQVGRAPLFEISDVPCVTDVGCFQAEAPLTAHHQIACSLSRVFYDAGCRSAWRTFLIDAGNRAPLQASVAFAERVRHDPR